MIGRVRCFMPAVRRGILQTEAGDELPFSVSPDAVDLQGGDLVEFELAGDGRPFASVVTLRHRWAKMLNEQHRSLVNQFHHTIRIST